MRPDAPKMDGKQLLAAYNENFEQVGGKYPKGACTNDVSREGEGGGYPNSDGRMGRLRDLYSKNSDKGGGGQKSRKFS